MARPFAYYRLTRSRQRRGLSYLEVLIAAGIGLAGLLGAIAIFPVAIMNLQRGVVSDTVAYIGPSALEQAQATGMLNRNNWLAYNATNVMGSAHWRDDAVNRLVKPIYLANPPPGSFTHANDLRNVIGAWGSICIDPRFCAEMDNTLGNSITANGMDAGQFPYVTTTQPSDNVRMLRVTLRSQPGSNVPMSVNQARLLFKTADDLIALKPDDNTSPAFLAPLMGKSNTPVRRDYMGDFEWMITLTPKMTGLPTFQNDVDSLGNAAAVPFAPTNQYLASVVVFHQRLPRLDSIEVGSTTDPDAERVVNVKKFFSNGFNGGDVLIQSTNALDLTLRAGDWVMLSGMRYSPGTLQIRGPLFQWYRVAAVEGEAATSSQYGGYERYVSLEGGDWPVTVLTSPAAQAGEPNTATSIVPTTQMTIVSGVVGVFEHTVMLD